MKIGVAVVLAMNVGCCAQLCAAELQVIVTDHNGKPVPDAVASALPVDSKIALRAPTPSETVDQVDRQFVPFVKVVFLGSTIRFPNSDNIRHQVYSFSPPKKFELPLYAGTPAQPVLFDKAGVVVLGCNIHDWMIGYIYVSETPFFAKTDAAGAAMIKDLPAGEYTVRVWQPRMDGSELSTARRISVLAEAPGVATSLNHAAWTVKLKPAISVSRVSGGSSAAYP
jgi:plastocyanin